MLLLFKPFRDLGELRADGRAWVEAFAEFEATASARIRRYISNFEALDNHKRAWECDVQQRELELLQEQRGRSFVEEEPEDARFSDGDDDSDYGNDDDEEPDVEPGRREPEINYMKFTSHEHNADQLKLYNSIMDNGLFRSTVADAVLLTDGDNEEKKDTQPRSSGDAASSWFSLASTATGTTSNSTASIWTSYLSKCCTASLVRPKMR